MYRSKFLLRAKQLTAPLAFVDALGHEQRGKKGDYLVESSSGLQRIWPRQLFEDAHVPLDPEEYSSELDLITRNGDKNGSSKARLHASEWSNPLSGIKTAKSPRKRPASCGKATVEPRIPAVNCLRYNM
jgi:hypothetical protein